MFDVSVIVLGLTVQVCKQLKKERGGVEKRLWTCVVDREKLHSFGTISLSINSS